MMKLSYSLIGCAGLLLASCGHSNKTTTIAGIDSLPLKPVVITEKVFDDPDDPAIWINPANPDSSLVIGTDKHKSNGGLYVFDLQGKIDRQRSVTGMKRMNNVDIAYG